jgi:1,4-alpha-glucan branching enzyme
MIAISPEGLGTICAKFRLQFGVGRHEICVVGEFNDWSRTANPMTFDGYGYVAEIVIPTGRAYRFQYLIDNERWQNDWAADSYAANESGGDDSVLDLTKRRSSIPGATASQPSTRGAPLATGRGPIETTEPA